MSKKLIVMSVCIALVFPTMAQRKAKVNAACYVGGEYCRSIKNRLMLKCRRLVCQLHQKL